MEPQRPLPRAPPPLPVPRTRPSASLRAAAARARPGQRPRPRSRHGFAGERRRPPIDRVRRPAADVSRGPHSAATIGACRRLAETLRWEGDSPPRRPGGELGRGESSSPRPELPSRSSRWIVASQPRVSATSCRRAMVSALSGPWDSQPRADVDRAAGSHPLHRQGGARVEQPPVDLVEHPGGWDEGLALARQGGLARREACGSREDELGCMGPQIQKGGVIRGRSAVGVSSRKTIRASPDGASAPRSGRTGRRRVCNGSSSPSLSRRTVSGRAGTTQPSMRVRCSIRVIRR